MEQTPEDIRKAAAVLKPCPFCGNTASFDRVGNRKQSTIVSCDDCGCSVENGEEWNHGRGWNARPLEDVLTARIAEQEKRIDALGKALRSYDEGMEAIGGCGDGNCQVVRPIGQHTNGGCRCSTDRYKAQRAMARGQMLAKAVREAALGALRQPKPAFTTGHCVERAKPKGCQLHNLHCGYPECDRRPVAKEEEG